MTVPLSAPVKGILCMTIGTLLITTQDAATKWLTADYSAGEVLFIRGLWSFLPLAVLVWWQGGIHTLRPRKPRLVWVRATLGALTSLVIIYAVSILPLADAIAVLFASPIILTALQTPMLGEKVGWQRWAAVMLGFVGVLIMLRPGGHGIEVALLVPLLAALLSALRDTTTRMLAGSDSSTTILFYTQVMSLVIGLPFVSSSTPFPDLFQMALFAFAGLMTGVAHYLMILSLLLAQGATVAPFRYLSLLWSVLLGWLIWHDLPDIWIIIGTVLVVASGLFVVRYETRLARAGRHA